MKFQKHLLNVERKKPQYSNPDKIRLHAAERDLVFGYDLWEEFFYSVKQTDIMYYPNVDKTYKDLSKFLNLSADNLIIGDGSDRIIKYIYECFAVKGLDVITTDPCFPMYKVYADLYNVNCKQIKYTEYHLDYDQLYNSINDNTSFVIISNPSSPIGDFIHFKEMTLLIEKAEQHEAIVVIDEAYIEFSGHESYSDLIKIFNNLIVIKTFSKAVGAAGIRFGYGIANKQIIDIMKKFSPMNEITSITGKWVSTIINNWSNVENYINNVKQNRDKATFYFLKKGYEVIPSNCNWIHVDKLDFDDNFVLRQTTLPWSDKTWTRLCIPGDEHNMRLLCK